jgi:tetratricopeptide (TPR) repeat protein
MAEQGKGSGDKSLEAEIDDWASAIDEWDANLSLPDIPAPKPAAPKPAAQPAPSRQPEPVAPPRAPKPAPRASQPETIHEAFEELTAGETQISAGSVPPPLDEVPLPAAPADDPLMHLFEGEMELPDEASQALGPMLGAPIVPEANAPVEPALYGDSDESTRVASASEFEQLLANEAKVAAEPRGGAKAAVKPDARAVPRAPEAQFPDESTRLAGVGEVEKLLDEEVAEHELPAPPPSSSAPRPSPLLPEPGSRLPSGRYPGVTKPPSGRYSTPAAPPAAPARPAAPPPDEDLDVEIELVAATQPLVIDEPAAPVDEDFYDDIAIVAGRSASAPTPVPPPVVESSRSADDLFDLSISVEGSVDDSVDAEPSEELTADELQARRSDPDRTPLPIEEAQPVPPRLRVVEAPAAAPETRTLVAARLAPKETAPLELAAPESVAAETLDVGYLREQLAFFDSECQLVPADDPGRAARLAFAAGRVAEQLGDSESAIERYLAVLKADPQHLAALRALRRLRLAEGKRDVALHMIDLEIEHAAPAEQRGLYAVRAELALAAGEVELAAASYQQILVDQPNDLGALTGLCDLAAARSDRAALEGTLARLGEALTASLDGATKAAIAVERARLDEAAGRASDAVSRFSEALGYDATTAQAAWGLWRAAVRGTGDETQAYARLIELQPAGELKRALERRLGLGRAHAGDVAAARAALQSAAADGAAGVDAVALRELAEIERGDGRLDEALAALQRVAEVEPDAGRRADLLVGIGELAEGRGVTAQAAAAYTRAAAEYPDDPRAARALERTQAAGGDKESALSLHLQAAERNPARAPMEWTYAARLQRELGRTDDALARLDVALATLPTLAPAVELAVEMHLTNGNPAAAARVLQRAADASDDAPTAYALRARAARLLMRAGATGDALAAVRALLDGAGGEGERPARWLEQRILRSAPDVGDSTVAEQHRERLLESLRGEAAEAESSGDPARAAQLWHEVALNGPADALELERKVLNLDPAYGPAALELGARVQADRAARAVEVPAILQLRLQAAAAAEAPPGGRPEGVMLDLRLGAALAEDADDPAGADAAFSDAERRAPGYGPALEALDRVAHWSDDDARVLAALERELKTAEAPEARFALQLLIGERLERQVAAPDRAAERYRQALELRPGHPAARSALERAYQTLHNHAALADLALTDLKEAPDARAKVRAYERLAFIDGELRGDPESALLGFESILEIDRGHHWAMRVLEKHYLAQQRWPELVELYEQMGRVAEGPAMAVAVHLGRARLRRRVGGLSETQLALAIDDDYRLALGRDGHCRPALRHGYARARAHRDLELIAELAGGLAQAVGDDARTAAVCLTRAAEALDELGRAEARAQFLAAADRGLHLPALVGLGDHALRSSDWASAAGAFERAGQVLRAPEARARAFAVAGALAQDRLTEGDRLERALHDLRQALAAEPRHPEAFARLDKLYRQLGDFAALAALYQRRVELEDDQVQLIALHLELAKLARDRIGDRERARGELKAVLALEPAHAEALEALGQLQFEDQQWADAAETLIRRVRLEKSRPALKEIFFKLGLIYSQHLPDAKRAVASFARVLQVTPDDLVALEHLSNLQMKEWDYKGALATTSRLAELVEDKEKKVAHLHRVAKIYEDGFKDGRHALEALRRALEIDPMYMPSIGELSRFFDRQSDVQSMRVHLDRAAARVRMLLEQNPYDVGAYRSLFKIFSWRRAPDRAALAAGVLDWLGAADDDEKAALAKLVGRDNHPGTALADPTLDELLFDGRLVPAGFRNLFRLLDEPLAKMFRADVKRLGVQRHEKLPRSGHAVRDLANRLAADLGVREFDLYLTSAIPTAVVIELADPLAIVIGNQLVEGAHELEMRFVLGRCLKMMQCHLALPMRLEPEDLGLLVGGIVRQFVPDFVPAGFEEAKVVAEAGRLARIIPKKMHAELLPFALECASDAIDLKQIGPALVHTANRAGLLSCGLPGPSLTAVRRLNDEAQVRALLRFTVSDELAELRRQMGTSIG